MVSHSPSSPRGPMTWTTPKLAPISLRRLNSGRRSSGREAVILDERADEAGRLLGGVGEDLPERRVRPCREALQPFERVAPPVAGEDVVVVDVDDDAGEPVVLRGDPRDAAADDRVRVGE